MMMVSRAKALFEGRVTPIAREQGTLAASRRALANDNGRPIAGSPTNSEPE
jgi:hypothetical protein